MSLLAAACLIWVVWAVWVAAEASEHNAEQPIVLLPDVLQKKIIDLLPAER